MLVLVLAACGEAERRAPPRRPADPPIVADAKTGAEWAADALRSSGYAADFSPRSLWEVDRFFAEQMARAGRARPDGLLAEQRGQKLFALGAYVGEVIRRNAAGWRWVPARGDPDNELGLRLVHERGSEIWPIQRAVKRYKEGPGNGIADYAAAVAELDVGPRP
jgi:hypothetical protein